MQYLRFIIFFLVIFVFSSCETEYIPDISNENPEIVVEGFIEAGPNASPPYVILTRTSPFFSTIDANKIDELFVHDAVITVTDGTNTTELIELCLNDLTPSQQQLAAEFLGLGNDSIGINICIYIEQSLTPILVQPGSTYDLRIEVEDKVITASTTVPFPAPLDSLSYLDLPDPANDSLVELRCFFSDPPETNYYRYFTKRNSDPLYPGLASVIDDVLFNSQQFEFPLTAGQSRTEQIDINTYGYFWKGDTILIKWSTIDEAHYQFWSTLEYNTSSDGPFTSFTKVATNIEGGIGIWGGYGSSEHIIIVPPL